MDAAPIPGQDGRFVFSGPGEYTPQSVWNGHERRKTPRTGRDTPRLYALYSVVFRRRMHTKTACKPYSRKGFQICIQCIQRIPTPFVFRLSLLLGREYMNTANTPGRSGYRLPAHLGTDEQGHPAVECGSGPKQDDGSVFSDPREYMRRPVPIGVVNAGNGANRPRHTRLYALYSFVFRCRMHTKSASQPYCRKGFRFCIQCIQRIPTPFVFRLSLLLGPEYMNTANAFGRSRTSRGSAEGGVRTPRSALPARVRFPRRVQVAAPHARSERNMPLRRE